MPLKKSIGQMYPWVTHTHCHLGGQCPHECVYCYVDHFPFGRPKKYQGDLRLIEKEFSVDYGNGKTIFIENCNDMLAKEVTDSMIYRILSHCLQWRKNEYVFQSKNPARFLTLDALLPESCMIGTTIETNRLIPEIGNAPPPCDRFLAMINPELKRFRKFITIEPILAFDVDMLVDWIKRIRPEFVNIGADSKGHNLPEPPAEKILALIDALTAAGIEVRKKSNLNRLLNPKPVNKNV